MMKVVALISGGKDSCYNMVQCVQHGHKIVALANLRPKDKDELDSYMFQTVGHHAVDLYAEAMGIPLHRRTIQGSSVVQGKTYVSNSQDEVEDLYELLKTIKKELLFDAVSVGAILSDYQRVRVEHVCGRLGLTCLSYLWRRNQRELLEEMISARVQAVIIKVAALGLDPTKHLGMPISQIFPEMCTLHSKYGLNICGEGGEYETFTLDCPLFTKRIVIDEYEAVTHSDDAFAPVGFLHFKSMHLEDKQEAIGSNIEDRVCGLPVCFMGDPVEPIPTDIQVKTGTGTTTEKEDTPVLDILQLPDTRGQIKESMARVSRCGKYLWVGDITGYSTDGKSIEEVTKLVMNKLSEKLASEGTRLSQALMVHLGVKNMSDFARVNSIYKKYLQLNPPARACIELDLAEKAVLQLDCLAYSPGLDEAACEHHREAMHVQSISHWAPANIGPYSQAVKVDAVTHVSGCIALQPATMTVVDGGIGMQSALSLRHVNRVITAFTPGSSLANVLQGFCYVTSISSIPAAREAWTSAWLSKTEESELCRGLMSYIVVPTLPRDALVEWQVISHSNPPDWQYIELRIKRSGFQLHFERIWSPDDMCCAVNCSVEPEVELKNGSTVQLQDVVESFISELKDVTSSCRMDLKHILTARIFYCKTATSATDSALRNVVEKKFSDEGIGEQPFTLVRVDGLDRSALVLFSLWLQDPSTART